jgi:cation diffusion facilitator CzcD-associated flavoprotein CzcO
MNQPVVAAQDPTREGLLDVVVVGGGQAGLAMAWHLRRQGSSFAFVRPHQRPVGVPREPINNIRRAASPMDDLAAANDLPDVDSAKTRHSLPRCLGVGRGRWLTVVSRRAADGRIQRRHGCCTPRRLRPDSENPASEYRVGHLMRDVDRRIGSDSSRHLGIRALAAVRVLLRPVGDASG